MKHADFIIASWLLSFGPITFYAWRNARRARRLNPLVDESDKPWT